MKNAIIGFFSIMLILLAGFAISTSDGKTLRKNELSSTLSFTMEQSMEILMMSKDYDMEGQKEFVADFVQNAMAKMNSESKYKVEVYEVDTEKGILDVAVTEKYRKFLAPGEVRVRRTMVLDDYSNDENAYFEVLFKDKTGKVIKQLNIHGGDSLSPSAVPQEYKDAKWRCEETGTEHTYTDFANIRVIRDLTFKIL